jgi:putative ABC transport system permease protein
LTNLFGLALGLATCIIIFLYVQDELSYDRQFENAENIYRLEPHWIGQGEDSRWAATQGSILPELIKSYPEITAGVKINHPYNPLTFSQGETTFTEKNVLLADSTFFNIFNYRVISGDPLKMLAGPNKVVMTHTTATRYFGTLDAVGEIIKLDERIYTISGVIADPPVNSHLQFDILISLDDLRSRWDGVDQVGASTFYSYVEFPEKKTADAVLAKVNQNIYSHFGYVVAGDSSNVPKGYSAEMIFMPITDIHLKGHAEKEISSNSDMRYVVIFSAVALFILLIACFNYMNLATAKSTRRSREVGLRKVMGATKGKIFNQFMGESLTMAIISMVIALLIVELLLPNFNQFTGKTLSLSFSGNPVLLVLIVAIIIIVGFLSGTYPSLFMSRFNTINILKSNSLNASVGKGSLYLRRALVIIQFAISVFLIICIIVVKKQLNFIQDKKLGFDKEQVMVVQLPNRAAYEKVDVLKNELLLNSDIHNVSTTSNIPGERIPFLTVKIPGDETQNMEGNEEDDDGIFGMRTWSAGFDMVETFGFEMAEGRSLSKEFGTDAEEAFLINEAAVREFEMENPLGHDFEYHWAVEVPKKGKIVGVIKDFHYASLHHEVEPLMVHIFTPFIRYIIIKLNGNNTKASIAKVEEIWNAHIPSVPMDYHFLDTSYDNLYREEQNTGTIITLFTILAVIIAVLGLFGLVSYITEQRTKEIGVRKVLGASVFDIIAKLSKEFVILISIVNVIAWIPAYYFLRNWLDTFAYSTDLSIWVFAVSALLSLLIAVITVMTKAIGTANSNPVEALKYE